MKAVLDQLNEKDAASIDAGVGEKFWIFL